MTLAHKYYSEVLQKMRKEIKFCQRCYNISDGTICSICANSGRQKNTICVVENIRDVIAFPKSGGGQDPLTGAPTPITPAQRKEAGVDFKLEK